MQLGIGKSGMLTSHNFRSRNVSLLSKKQNMHINISQQMDRQKPLLNSNSFRNSVRSSSFTPSQTSQYRSAIVFNNSPGNKQLIYNFNGDQKRQIASLTKIMTCLIALQFIQSNEIIPEEIQCQVSSEAAQLKGTTAGLDQGDRLSLWDLLHGMMLPSGNDAAYCIAENIGKMIKNLQDKNKYQDKIILCSSSRSRNKKNRMDSLQHPIGIFVKQMNKTAIFLQMNNTNYTNPHGLADSYNFSTAKDQLTLIQACLQNQLFKSIVSTKLYFGSLRESEQIWTRQVIWQNTNRLLYRGFQGIKTGNTGPAGYCLASWYLNAENDIIVIVLGCNSKEERDWHSLRLTKMGLVQKQTPR